MAILCKFTNHVFTIVQLLGLLIIASLCKNGLNSLGKNLILRLKQIIASVSLKRENLRGLRENFMLENSNLEHAMRAPLGLIFRIHVMIKVDVVGTSHFSCKHSHTLALPGK